MTALQNQTFLDVEYSRIITQYFKIKKTRASLPIVYLTWWAWIASTQYLKMVMEP